MTDVYTLPPDLPVPEDDGAADHLVGLELPDLTLPSSQGDVNVRDFDVIYIYPRSGRPGVPLLAGWDETPGARGCTPQSCAFRDALSATSACRSPGSPRSRSTTSSSSRSGTGCRSR